MKIRRDSAVKLLEALGYDNAPKYADAIIIKRLTELETNVADHIRLSIKEPSASRLMRTVVNAIKRGDAVEIIQTEGCDEVEEQNDKITETLTRVNVTEAKQTASVDMEPPKKGYKRKTAGPVEEEFPGLIKTESKPHRYGTVKRVVFEVLRDCDISDAVTKKEILEVLNRKFPFNSSTSMRHVVDSFPHWLPKHYPYKVHQIDKRYWLEEIKAETQSENK